MADFKLNKATDCFSLPLKITHIEKYIYTHTELPISRPTEILRIKKQPILNNAGLQHKIYSKYLQYILRRNVQKDSLAFRALREVLSSMS